MSRQPTRQQEEPPVYVYPRLASWQPTLEGIAALAAQRHRQSVSRRQATPAPVREEWPGNEPFAED